MTGQREQVKAGHDRSYQWTLVDTHETRGRTFRRPLNAAELSFVWDGRFNGVTDNLKHVTLRLSRNSDHGGDGRGMLFSEDNVVRAWLDTKRRFPLIGATVVVTEVEAETIPDMKKTSFDDTAYFVVSEADLSVVRAGEIVFGQVASAEDAQQHATSILDHSSSGRTRQLSEVLLVQLHVFRETAPAPTDSDDSDLRLHIMALMSHCITDETANYLFLRYFLDALARGDDLELPEQLPLEERLAMVVASTSAELEPGFVHTLGRARQRWRRAIGFVIFQLRSARTQGGHTLPWRRTSLTPYVDPRSAQVGISFTHAETSVVLATCRLYGFTFGTACYVLAQVAMTRVLYRRYLRGEISKEEWEYRKRQPFIGWGPINLRRYLDRAWFERGGGSEVMLCLGGFTFQLPFMTLGSAEQQYAPRVGDFSVPDNVPQLSELLTFNRFLYRVRLAKKQVTAYFKHPLFLEIAHAASVVRLQSSRLATLEYLGNSHPKSVMQVDSCNGILPVTDVSMVPAYGGASLGNVDLIFPSEYPLPLVHPLSPRSPDTHHGRAGHATLHSGQLASTSTNSSVNPKDAQTHPTILVEYTGSRLHAVSAQLFHSVWTLQGRLQMAVYYDGNVFEDVIVKEWLDELKDAALWYLGQTSSSKL